MVSLRMMNNDNRIISKSWLVQYAVRAFERTPRMLQLVIGGGLDHQSGYGAITLCLFVSYLRLLLFVMFGLFPIDRTN